jgi:hypothetical protein
MDQLTLGIGTRLQHTAFGPGVIVGVKYATYLISFIYHGIKEIDKKDDKLEEIIPENVSLEIETTDQVEKSLLKFCGSGTTRRKLFPLVSAGLAERCCCNPAMHRKNPKNFPLMLSFTRL